jgi:oligopeptide transport system substrate-binding protein
MRDYYKLLIFVFLMIFSSCQTENKPMNTLRLNFQEGDLPTLHPQSMMLHLRGICLAKNIYECLTRMDAEGNPQLAGAESFELSDDQLHYRFTLKDNYWSDGSPVTAYQYEKAWKEALSPVSNCSRSDLFYMIKNAKEAKEGALPLDAVGVKALDDKTLVVELAFPSPYFLVMLSRGISAPLADSSLREPELFNGPFMVDAWQRGDYLTLKPNPYYWDKQNVSLDQIKIYMVQDIMTAFTMYEKGEIDWVGVPFILLPPEIITALEQNKTLRTLPSNRAFWVFLNAKAPHLSSVAIREALSLALDRKAISDHILMAGDPLVKPLPPSLLPLPPAHPLEENLDKAKERFAEGLRELGLTKETFPSLEITYSQQANRKQLAQYLQETWSRVFGIKVEASPQEWNTLRANLENGQFEAVGYYETASYNDPLQLLEKYKFLTPSNFSKWVNSDYVDMLEQAKREANPQLREAFISKAEQILMDEMPIIPICGDKFLFAHHPSLSGYIFDGSGACDVSKASLVAQGGSSE